MQRQRVARLRPLDEERPVCGFRNGNVIFSDARSSTVLTSPVKQSSVQSSSTSPGFTVITGSAPPNVQRSRSAQVGTD
jgi:hypothetical protein